jgi:iron complex outermembrane receptor protein
MAGDVSLASIGGLEMSRKNKPISTDIAWSDASNYWRERNKVARETAIGVALSFLFMYVGIAEASQPSAGTDAVGVAEASPVKVESAPASGGPELQEVVVTAQRRPEKLNEVPISVQAVTGSELSRQDIQDSTDLVRVLPELSFTSQSATAQTSFSLRGVSSAAGQDGIQPSTAVVIDDVPVVNQGEAVLNLLDIDHIEVLNGPQGTLFGKNSTAGVINIIHNRPTNELDGWLEVNETTDQETSVRGMANVPINSWISTRLVGFYDDLKSLTTNLGVGGPQNASRSWGTSGKISADPTENLNVLISAGYAHTAAGNEWIVIDPTPGALGALQRQVTGLPYGYGQNTVNVDSPSGEFYDAWNMSAELNWQASKGLNLTSISSYRALDEDFTSDVDSTPAGVNIGRGYSPNPLNYPVMSVGTGFPANPNHIHYVSQEVRLNYASGPFDSIFGVYYQYDKEFQESQTPLLLDGTYLGITPTFGTFFYNNSRVSAHYSDTTAAAFADTTFKFTDTLKIFAGLRETRERVTDDYNRQSYFNPAAGFFNPITTINSAPPTADIAFAAKDTISNLSGRAGLQWQPTQDLNYYVSYSRGYKGPAADLSVTATTAANDIIKPEIAQSYEIGAKQRLFNRRLNLNLALFSETIQNIQETAVVPPTGTKLISAGNLKTRGIEASFAIIATDHLQITGGAIYDDAYYGGFSYSCNTSQTPRVGGCGANGLQNLAGQQAVGAPKVKVNVGPEYRNHLLSTSFQYYANVNYTWQDSIQYELDESPLTRQPSVGLLNAAVGVISDDGHWEARLYGNNLTNKPYYNNLVASAPVVGALIGWLPRDFKIYGGISLKYKF